MAEKQGPADRREDDGAASRCAIADPIDAIVALALLTVCAGLALVTATFDEVSELLAQNVPPEIFPRILLALIAGLTLFLPFERRFNRVWSEKRRTPGQPVPAKTWATVALLAGLGLAAPYLGTLLAILAISIAVPLLWGERRLLRVVVFAVVFTLLVAGLFNLVLEVHFEPGRLAAGWLWPG